MRVDVHGQERPRLDEIGSAVRAEDVGKSYRQGETRVAALHGVSLEIGTAEFVAVMGPSGSGKSTLLHLLGGLDVPDSGTIAIAGRTLGAMSDDELTVFRRRHLGIVFQAFNLVPTLTAEENVALPLRLDGVSARTARARVVGALGEVGMRHRRGHRPDQLSGGELQRVALARALVVEPLLVLADEPTGSLDSRTSEEMLGLLHRASRDLGRTVVMVTHDPVAAAYASRVVRVVDGMIDARVPGLRVAAGGAA
jgi:putative ABC transport system ATP-binding protein